MRAFLHAIEGGNIDAVRKLVREHGAQKLVNESLNNGGWKPIMIAAENGYLGMVKELVALGADVNSRNSAGWSALMVATEHNHVDVASYILSLGVNINTANDAGYTALMIAGENSRLEPLKLLLSRGADPNMQNLGGWSVLMIASERGNVEIVGELLKHGVNINAKSTSQWNAVMITCREGSLEILRELLKRRPNINDKNNSGCTALMIASEYNQVEVVKELLAHNANPLERNDAQWTPLMSAAHLGFLEIVVELLKAGSNINDRNNNGATALHLACIPKGVSNERACQVIRLLVANNADTTIRGSEALVKGKTPAACAKNNVLRAALAEAIQDKRDGKLESLVCKPTAKPSLDNATDLHTGDLENVNANTTTTTTVNGLVLSESVEETTLPRGTSPAAQAQAARDGQDADASRLQSSADIARLQSELEGERQSRSAVLGAERAALQQQLQLQIERERASLRESHQTVIDMLQSHLSTLRQQLAASQQHAALGEQKLRHLEAELKAGGAQVPQFSIDAFSYIAQHQTNLGGIAGDFLLGTPVSIKRVVTDTQVKLYEFKTEIYVLSRFRHPNIVSLLGFAELEAERFLVYESLQPESVRDRLDRKGNTMFPLSWGEREIIALGVARAMLYLQYANPKSPVVHVALRSSAVMLDAQNQPKLVHVSLASPMGAVGGSSNVSSSSSSNSSNSNGGMSAEGAGGAGLLPSGDSYVCPEYRAHGRVSRKTDVYGYGLLLLELVTGLKLAPEVRNFIRSHIQMHQSPLSLLDGSIAWSDEQKQRAVGLMVLAVKCIEDFRLLRPSFIQIIDVLHGRETAEIEQMNAQLLKECNLCLQAPIEAIFLPCNHLAACRGCAAALAGQRETCFVCKTPIESIATA